MSDLVYYDRLPYYRPKGLSRLPEGYYGEAAATVVRVIGPCSDEHAMKVVDAVLGPLELVPPMPDFRTSCDHTRFTFEGEWHACTKQHGDSSVGDSEHHASDSEDWYEADADGRSFSLAGYTGPEADPGGDDGDDN